MMRSTNPYQETADRIRTLIREFAAALPKPEPRLKSARRKVSIAFIEAIVSMAEASQDPRILEHFDVRKARETLEFVKAVRPILSLLTTFATSLNATLRLNRAILTAQLRETYDAASKLAPEERSPGVVKFVEDLKPFFGKRVRRRRIE